LGGSTERVLDAKSAGGLSGPAATDMPTPGVGRLATVEMVGLPSPCVVILAGPGASGKSTWAAAHFPAEFIVSSDALRALVGSGEDDLGASADAFALLEEIVKRRMARRLTTVIDTLGLDATRRRAWLAASRAAGLACVAVTFDTPARECRARNRTRARPLPTDVLTAQLRGWPAERAVLVEEGYDVVMAPEPARLVAETFATAAVSAHRQQDRPTGLRFGLHLGEFGFPGGSGATAQAIKSVAMTAEAAGFDAIYVMDHFRQIPQIGRRWHDFLESYTTLGYLAAATDRVRLGALVTGVTYRNPAHLGKIVATLDVLSGGRAVCGLGLSWFKEEHVAYGWDFPSVADRYRRLEDTLRVLRLMWGPGSPSFVGSMLSVPEALCYPRPLQDHLPIVVGGGGEKRTLRLAARYADLANVLGDVATVRRKASVLESHCLDAGRDPRLVELTHLSTVLVGADDRHVRELIDRHRPRGQAPAAYAAAVHAGTIQDHIGRFRELADAGVREVMLRLPDPLDDDALNAMTKVISAFH
jgi:F420-dependent oxidoreductase-like protein